MLNLEGSLQKQDSVRTALRKELAKIFRSLFLHYVTWSYFQGGDLYFQETCSCTSVIFAAESVKLFQSPVLWNTALKLSKKYGKKEDLHKGSNAANWGGNSKPSNSPKTVMISTTFLSYFLSWGPVRSGAVALWSGPTCKKSYEQGFGLRWLLVLSYCL